MVSKSIDLRDPLHHAAESYEVLRSYGDLLAWPVDGSPWLAAYDPLLTSERFNPMFEHDLRTQISAAFIGHILADAAVELDARGWDATDTAFESPVALANDLSALAGGIKGESRKIAAARAYTLLQSAK